MAGAADGYYLLILARIDAILCAFVVIVREALSAAAGRCSHQPQKQAEWKYTIKNKGQNTTDHGGVRDGSEQSDVQPGDGNDIHARIVTG